MASKVMFRWALIVKKRAHLFRFECDEVAKKVDTKFGANLNVCKINDVKMSDINRFQAFKKT